MIFNGIFGQLTPAQCCAILSCFVFDENTNEIPKLTEELSAPLRQMQASVLHFITFSMHF